MATLTSHTDELIFDKMAEAYSDLVREMGFTDAPASEDVSGILLEVVKGVIDWNESAASTGRNDWLLGLNP